MKTVKDIDIDGKRVFIRCDFNVPKDEFGNITDDRRIRSALQTIRYCIDRDCRIILASHYERPEPGKYEEKYSLKPVAKRLHTLLKIKNEIFPALGVESPALDREVYTLKQFMQELILVDPDIKVALTEKERHAYDFADCICEYADVQINGAFVRTLAFESENPDLVYNAIEKLNIGKDIENVNYPKALKRVLGLEIDYDINFITPIEEIISSFTDKNKITKEKTLYYGIALNELAEFDSLVDILRIIGGLSRIIRIHCL